MTEAIRGTALCALCITRKTGAAPLGVLATLANIGRGVKITDAVTRCEDCLKLRNTHRLS